MNSKVVSYPSTGGPRRACENCIVVIPTGEDLHFTSLRCSIFERMRRVRGVYTRPSRLVENGSMVEVLAATVAVRSAERSKYHDISQGFPAFPGII